MPPLPKVVKHHPKGVGLVKIEELVRLALERDENMNLKKFLMISFEYITSLKVPICCARILLSVMLTHVGFHNFKTREIIDSLGSKFSDSLPVANLTQPMQMHLQKVISKMEWEDPDGAALSPAGEYNL